MQQIAGLESNALSYEDITQPTSSSASRVNESFPPPVLAQLKPGDPPFRIMTMKGLFLRSILYSRYFYNLHCDASWVVETGTSSTQDKSRIVNIILPFIMSHCTDDDKAVLTSPKPDSSSPEFDSWNSRLLSRTAEIEKRLEKHLENEESICFPSRDKKKLRRKQMSVNGVEGRLAEIKKMKRTLKSSTINSIFHTVDITLKTLPSDKVDNDHSSYEISSHMTSSSKKNSDSDVKRQQNLMSSYIRK
jgi:hypothetical protein